MSPPLLNFLNTFKTLSRENVDGFLNVFKSLAGCRGCDVRLAAWS
jgi:hypothetical protein